jgi:uncharacterized radical SAM protein YgiQ
MSLPTPKMTNIFKYPKYWAECLTPAPYLPMSKHEMDELGWDSCDIIIVTADAYVDHPSFGMAVIGRFLESQGFRVGIISQPRWNDAESFKQLGEPNLFFGVTGGNMDSLINRYTADLKIRSEDAYTPNGESGKRPDRSVIVYSQRCREAYYDVPIIIGGIEASSRRIAQYDYWSNEVRRSILLDANADVLLYGNAERAIAEIAHQLANGKSLSTLHSIRGTAFIKKTTQSGWVEIDSTRIDWPSRIDEIPNPYEYDKNIPPPEEPTSDNEKPLRIVPMPLHRNHKLDSEKTYIRLPSYNKVKNDPALYAHASRVLHQESNPYNARPLVQKHDTQDVWVNPPPIPLEMDEMDGIFDLPYQRRPHPSYQEARIPAYEMIKTSVNIMRGCFGGCTFCSITEHEGRIIQSRSEESVLREIEKIRDQVPGFTGTISDLGGPTANMYRLNCKSPEIQKNCRRLSCVYPTICKHLDTDHKPTTQLYRKAREIPGVKTVFIASGLRYDLALRDPEYIEELVTHHVGGYLKIAPEHSEEKTLSKMMKPSISSYDEFKKLFDKYSKKAGKKQYLIPYFIAAHPGSEDEDMLNLGLWLKQHKFKPDQVQTFYPSPMALAFLRYHDEKNWPLLRDALRKMGRADLIGSGEKHLVPDDKRNTKYQARKKSASRRNITRR